MLKRLLIIVAVLLVGAGGVHATIISSTNYILDPNVADTFGGLGSSANYKITDAGGETVVGAGSSGSYQLTAGYVSQLTQSMQINAVPTGVQAYYPFDTGTGTQAYDVSTNENNGTLTGGATWGTGKIGGDLVFNGTSAYVDVPNSGSLNLTGSYTLETWVNHVTSAGMQGIVSKDVSGSVTSSPYAITWNGTTPSCTNTTSGNTTVSVASSTAATDGVWNHIVCTNNGSQLKIYLNGTLTGTASAGNPGSTTGTLKIGQEKAGANRWWKGQIDELKIYNRAMSATEINDQYNAENSGVVSAQTIPALAPGTSQNTSTDAIVRTDSAGYDLAIQQNHDLLNTDAVTTISPVTSSIASPAVWTEGTTKGLGFTVTAGSNIEPKWGSNPNYAYAAIPGTATTFHGTGSGLGGAPERNTLQFRLDTPGSQKSGSYSNLVTFTATGRP